MMKYSAMKGGKRPGEYPEKGGRKIFAEREVSKKAEAIRNGRSAAGGQFKMLRSLVVLLRWRDRPLMRPTAGAALAGAFCPITCALGVPEPLSAAV